jgi:hypothetical protein
MIRDCKGNIEVAFVIIFSIALFFTTLFIFITDDSKLMLQINGAGFLDNVYVKEKIIEYYIDDAGEEAMLELNNFDKDIWRIKFKEKIKRHNFEEDYLIELQKKTAENDFEVLVEENEIAVRFNFELEDSVIEENKETLKIIYKPVIEKRFDLAG